MANEHNLTPFQPGNKAGVGYGRPKGKSMTSLFKKIAEQEVTLKNAQGEPETRTTEEWIVISTAQKAMKGNASDRDLWFNRLYGKVTNTLEVSDIREKKAQELTTEELEGFLQGEENK